MAKIVLKDVRIAFCQNLFEAKPFQPGQTPKFSSSFLFAPGSETAKLVQSTVKQVAQEKFGAKADSVLASIKGVPNKMCFRNGDSKPDYEGYPGNLFVSASNKTRPTVLDRDKTPLIMADGKPYAGCYVNAIVDIWAQDNQFGKGIQASLLGVQFVRDGDAFAGGGVANEDDFDDLGEGADAPAEGGTASSSEDFV